MNRKTLTALAVLVVLGVVAVVVMRQPEKGQVTGERPRPLPKMAAGSFDTLTVTKGTSTTTIKREGDKYKITSPGAYSADENVAKQAFEAIEKLEFGSVVSDQKEKQTEFEVDDKGLKVAIKKGEQVLGELLVGKGVGGNTLVRVPGKNEIWQGLGSFKYNFDRDTTGWRDKTITKFDQAEAEKIDLVGPGGSKAVVKKGTGDQWTVQESTVKVEKVDGSVPSGIVSALSSWITNEFAEDAKPDVTGLDKPKNTVTVELKGGKKVTVLIDNKKKAEDTYVKTADSPQVYLVKRYNVERVDKHPIDLRDKTLCDISDADLGEVAVTHDKDSYTLEKDAKKNEWKVAKPSGVTLDPSKVTPIASAFKDWKGAGFAEDQSPKANGLGKPVAVITAKSKDKKKSCTLKIGDESSDKTNRFVAVGSDVLVAPKWSIDRVLVKVEDLKKK